MCGISGLIGIESQDTIEKMVEVQAHRGPDDSGIAVLSKTPPVYFGHNRLSIIDLSSRGHQPMFNEDRSLCIVYNGEIYNFKEIRKELEQYGYAFFSDTDTEVILKAYDLWGIKCLNKFNGMFALAIFDSRRKKLYIARDRIGIKPLYYWSDNNKFAFASEIKALLQVREIREKLSLDMEAFVSYISLLWSPYTSTPFTTIKRLPQGSFMELDITTGKYSINSFWQLDIKKEKTPFKETTEKVRSLLTKSVKRRMLADVKVGAFLSGGLDSSAITALMAKNTTEQVEAFTIAFSKDDQKIEAMMDDYRYAVQLADNSGFNLHKIEISADETSELLPKIVYHLDEPIGDPAAINTYLMAKLAKERNVKVLLSGQGSDEIFGGYRKYLASVLLEKYKRAAPALIQFMVNKIVEKLPVMIGNKGIRQIRWLKRFFLDKPDDIFGIYYSICLFIDLSRLSKILEKETIKYFTDRAHKFFFDSVEGSFLDRMCYTDTMLFLPGLNLNYCDKATMAASIECRVPFCDHELVEFAFSIPENYKIKNFTQKYILKKALENLLPRDIIYRPKMPFSSPLRSWVKKGLKELVDEYLSENRLKKQVFFNYKGVRELIEEDRKGIRDNAHVIYGLLTMQIWMETFGIS